MLPTLRDAALKGRLLRVRHSLGISLSLMLRRLRSSRLEA